LEDFMGIVEEKHTKDEFVYVIKNPAPWVLLFLVISIPVSLMLSAILQIPIVILTLAEPGGVVFKVLFATLFLATFLLLNQLFGRGPEIFYRKLRASARGKKVSDAYTDKGVSGWSSTRVVRIQR
jgi:hypothetical protein